MNCNHRIQQMLVHEQTRLSELQHSKTQLQAPQDPKKLKSLRRQIVEQVKVIEKLKTATSDTSGIELRSVIKKSNFFGKCTNGINLS